MKVRVDSSSVRDVWCSRIDVPSLLDGVEIVNNPFHCASVSNFIVITDDDNNFLSDLTNELINLPLFEKNNDLYQFWQSDDLKLFHTENITKLKNFFHNEVKQFMQNVTGIDLNENIDLTVSVYKQNNVLLCHDDELEDRRIAFILYLTSDWTIDDGGRLDLFNVDAKNRPTSIAHSFVPSMNGFAFFEVQPNSFHQVSEILSNKKRISVNGWFHGEPVKRIKVHIDPLPLLLEPVDFEYEELLLWINPSYLDPKTQLQIRKQFEEESQIELMNFIQSDKYELIVDQLKVEKEIRWKTLQSRNMRFVDTLDFIDLNAGETTPVQTCLNLFKSEAMFLILSQLTGLELHNLVDLTNDVDTKGTTEGDDDVTQAKKQKLDSEQASKNNSKCFIEFNRWKYGNYSLCNDLQKIFAKSAQLDAQYFVCCEDWNADFGGSTIYLAKDEDEELLTIQPQQNCLALVYREHDTLKFTKYINSCAKDNQFCEISAVFVEECEL